MANDKNAGGEGLNGKTPNSDFKPSPNATNKEIHHHYHYDRGFNFGKILLGALVVLFGIFYLGRNTGWLPVDLYVDWSIFWPILIIIAGLSLLSGRGWVSGIFGFIISLLVLAIIVMILFGSPYLRTGDGQLFWTDTFYGKSSTSTPSQQNRDISVSLSPDARSAEFSLKGGAGKISIKGGTDQMIEGSYGSDYNDIEVDSSLEGTTQKISLEMTSSGPIGIFGLPSNTLDLRVSQSLPIKFDMKTGASDMELDLTRLVLTEADIETGASSLKLALGDKAKLSDVRIKAGASAVIVEVPSNCGIKAIIDSALGSKDLDGLEKMDDNTYQSANYDTAEKKINLTFELGVSSLEIKQK